MPRQINKYQFHAPSDNQKATMQKFRDAFESLDRLIRLEAPDCEQRHQALMRLEEAAVWANKAANQRDD